MKIIGYTLAVLFLGLIVWLFNLPKLPEGEVLSNEGLHWHSQLSIKIKGEAVEIPTDIGIGAIHQPIHTHDNTGTLHLEFSGTVRKSDTELGKFFSIWGKTFSDQCIMDKCNGPDGTLTMLVNGATSTEYGTHQMKDGEKIELIFD